jgi:hypothetical protein
MMARMDLSRPVFVTVFERFYLMANVIVFAWLALGASELFRRWPRWLVLGFVGIAIVVQLGINWQAESQRGNRVFIEFAQALLEPLPPHALLLTRGDLMVNVIRYAQLGERARPDVVSLDLELLAAPWFERILHTYYSQISFPGSIFVLDPHAQHPRSYTLLQLVDANIGQRSIFLNLSDTGPAYTELQQKYDLIPMGLVRAVRPKSDLDLTQLQTQRPSFVTYAQAIHFSQTPPPRWEALIFHEVESMDGLYGNFLLSQAFVHHNDSTLFAEAARVLLQVTLTHPRAFAFKNLGMAYYNQILQHPELAHQATQAWQTYLSYNEADPDIATIRRLLSQISK